MPAAHGLAGLAPQPAGVLEHGQGAVNLAALLLRLFCSRIRYVAGGGGGQR